MPKHTRPDFLGILIAKVLRYGAPPAPAQEESHQVKGGQVVVHPADNTNSIPYVDNAHTCKRVFIHMQRQIAEFLAEQNLPFIPPTGKCTSLELKSDIAMRHVQDHRYIEHLSNIELEESRACWRGRAVIGRLGRLGYIAVSAERGQLS